MGDASSRPGTTVTVNGRNSVRPSEYRFVLACGVIALIITSIPYLLGVSLTTGDRVFGGFVYAVEDGNSYLTKMQVGAAGHWLFYLAYTPEPHQGGLFFLYYILLGKLSRLFGLSMAVGLHLSRLVTVPFGLLCYYRFIAYWTSDRAARKLGLVLFGFTAGLGWLWVALGGEATLGAMPVDLWVPDASYFFSALIFPHLPLAQGLLLWFVTDAFDFLSTGRKRSGAWAALVGLVVSFIHPYTLPVIMVILGLFVCVKVIRREWRFWPAAGRLLLLLVPSIPYLVYNGIVFWTNPAFRAWREQSQTISPLPVHYVLGMGLILPWAAVGLTRRRAAWGRHASFLVVWAVAVPILIYVPSSIQRRFLDGYQAPLTVLGTWGIQGALSRLRRPFARKLLLTLSVSVMMLSNVFLLVGAMALLPGSGEPIFRPVADQQAADWLAQRARNEVVLSSHLTGNYLPTRGAVRVFLGHGPETMHSREKQKLVERFFDPETDDAWRWDLIATFDVMWVWWGPWERALGTFDPHTASYLQPVYEVGAYTIFEVKQ
ncbi:MAG: hypothetical protein GY832_20650 [Chloroflexi bacterium]|nr:hypothetical protein [Chloroflexota bacterium]